MIHIYATVVFSMFVLLVTKHDHTEKLYLFIFKGGSRCLYSSKRLFYPVARWLLENLWHHTMSCIIKPL